ncbi:MAG: response regulator transcription factor [Deltaproteobacteria bacterium]|jgi:DNA-binding LytR/AlgR family response regulator|nr:response regulator transcription factor [Deltaproteobacteria bacterium]
MKMKILIADDEKAARQKIKSLLKDFAEVGEIEEAQDGQIALEKIDAFNPDLVFLDIQMPKLTGLEVAAQCTEKAHKLVFVTAYDLYAIKAFETHAIDYLLKPVSKSRFQKTMERVLSFHQSEPEDTSNLQQLIKNLTASSSMQRLALKSSGSLLLIEASDVAFCQAEEGISKVCLLKSGELKHHIDSLYSDLSLAELLGRLPDELFLQVHRSYLVNLQQILAIHPDGRSHYLQLKEFPSLRIPVSRSQFPELRQRIQRL